MRSLLGRFHRPFARGVDEQLLLLNNLGDGSTLSLDFTTGVLDPRLTFTRSTTGTFINASGLVASAAINTARFTHDANGNPLGLLLEGSSNNLLNWSESFASSGGTNNNWTDTSISRTTGQADPAGGTTAIRFTASAGNATVISSAAIGTSAQRTFSIWLRRVTGTGNIEFTTNNGTTWTTQAITSSWVRYTFPATTAAQRVGIRIVTSGDAIEMWGAMLEDGSGSSSYIQTGASQGNRAFDYCEMGNIAALNYSTTNGSMLYEGQFSQFRATSFATMRTAFCTAAGATEAFGAFAYGATMYPTAQDGAGNTALATISPVMTLNTNLKAAWSLNTSLLSGEVRGCINGGSVAASGATSMSATATPTILTIGGRPSYGLHYPCGTIKSVRYWPTTLSNDQLQALTT